MINNSNLTAIRNFIDNLQTGTNQPNGYVTLDNNGLLPSDKLPLSVMEFKTAWNASTNSPTLTNGDINANLGDFYIVSDEGEQWGVQFLSGDFVVYTNSNEWKKVKGTGPKRNITATTDPLLTDDSSLNYNVSSLWVNQTTDKIYMCVDNTLNNAIWIDISSQGVKNFADLDDTQITNPINNDVLNYNGAQWVNTSAITLDQVNVNNQPTQPQNLTRKDYCDTKVLSVAGTLNQITAVNDGLNNITLSTPQNLNTTAQVQFNRVSLNLQPNQDNNATTKLYVDTALADKISTLTSTEPNLLSIDNTDPANLTITPQIAFGDAPKYELANGANASGKISTNNNGNFNLATTISLNYNALNRFTDLEYVKNYLSLSLNKPFEILLTDTITGDTADFFITGISNIGNNAITYNCQFYATDSSVSTFATGTELTCFFSPLQQDFTNQDGNIIINKSDIQNPTLNLSTTLVNQINTNTSNITSNNNAILGLIADVSTNTTNIASNNNAILSLTATVNTKVSTITNQDGRITVNSTNPINPIINLDDLTKNAIGAQVPFYYLMQSTGLPVPVNRISVNNSVVASITSLNIGIQPNNYGVYMVNSIDNLLHTYQSNGKFKIRIERKANQSEYFTMLCTLNTFTEAGIYRQYNCSYLAGETTIANSFLLDEHLNVYIMDYVPNVQVDINTNDIISLTNQQNTNSTLISQNTGNISNLQVRTTQNENDILTNATNLGITNGNVATNTANIQTNTNNIAILNNDIVDILSGKNTFDNATFQIITSTREQPSAITFNAFGSATVAWNGQSDWLAGSLWRPKYPIILGNRNTDGVQGSGQKFYAFRFEGSSWAGSFTEDIWVGFATETAVNNLTSANSIPADLDQSWAHNGVWEVNSGRKSIQLRCGGTNTQGFAMRGGTTTVLPYSQIGGVDVNPNTRILNQGDVMMVVVWEEFASIDLLWFRGTNLLNPIGWWWSNVDTTQNHRVELMTTPVIPIFSNSRRLITQDRRITFLSERECTDIGLNTPSLWLPNGTNIFY